MELFISHTVATDNWLKEHHYLHSVPAGARVRMEFYISYAEAELLAQEYGFLLRDLDMLDGKCLVGAMMWGHPTSRKIDQRAILELTRCCFLDFMPKNTESKGLAKARAWIRKNLPEIKGLIAYAITIRLDGTLGSQPGVLSVSCLSYNGRSNWLACLCLGFYARNEDCQPSSHCSVRFEQVEP